MAKVEADGKLPADYDAQVRWIGHLSYLDEKGR